MIDENSVRHMSQGALAHLGAEDMAYIKMSEIDGNRYFVLMSAVGQELVAAAQYDAVLAAAYERDLTVVSVN